MSIPAVLVLASGRGERFVASGGTGSKLQARLSGITVLDRTLTAVRGSGLRWHLEDAGHPGMGDSIAAAVRATQDADGWLILPGDLPLVRAATLVAVAHAVASHAVVLPRYLGEQGHPVGFGVACRDALLALSGAQGASPIVRAQREVCTLDVDDAGVVTDIDTVQDLSRVEALLLRR